MTFNFYVMFTIHDFNCIFHFAVLNTNVQSAAKRKSDERQVSPTKIGGSKYGYLKEIHTKHKIKRQKLDCDEPVSIGMYVTE